MGAEFGVAPNPELGDELELGAVDEPYHDVLHLLLPTYINDVSPSYAFNDDTLLDSLAISSVTATNLRPWIAFRPGLELDLWWIDIIPAFQGGWGNIAPLCKAFRLRSGFTE